VIRLIFFVATTIAQLLLIARNHQQQLLHQIATYSERLYVLWNHHQLGILPSPVSTTRAIHLIFVVVTSNCATRLIFV